MKNKLMLSVSMLAAMLTFGTSFAKAADGPSDPQIVGIVLTADQLDIDYARIALAKSKNKSVREFAQLMVTDHSAVQGAVVNLAAKLGVTGDSSPTRNSLENGGVEVKAKLASLTGAAFDKYYIDNEVGYHKAVNDAVANVLIPSAQNADLKGAIQGVQALFIAHGKHAEMIQAALNGSHAGM